MDSNLQAIEKKRKSTSSGDVFHAFSLVSRHKLQKEIVASAVSTCHEEASLSSHHLYSLHHKLDDHSSCSSVVSTVLFVMGEIGEIRLYHQTIIFQVAQTPLELVEFGLPQFAAGPCVLNIHRLRNYSQPECPGSGNQCPNSRNQLLSQPQFLSQPQCSSKHLQTQTNHLQTCRDLVEFPGHVHGPTPGTVLRIHLDC